MKGKADLIWELRYSFKYCINRSDSVISSSLISQYFQWTLITFSLVISKQATIIVSHFPLLHVTLKQAAIIVSHSDQYLFLGANILLPSLMPLYFTITIKSAGLLSIYISDSFLDWEKVFTGFRTLFSDGSIRHATIIKQLNIDLFLDWEGYYWVPTSATPEFTPRPLRNKTMVRSPHSLQLQILNSLCLTRRHPQIIRHNRYYTAPFLSKEILSSLPGPSPRARNCTCYK